MDHKQVTRFWYLNYKGRLDYRTVEINQPGHYIEAPGFNYAPGWFVSGYDLDRPDTPAYRSFSLDATHMGFASPTHWTDRGNVSPVANCAKAFGVSYETALSWAHFKTHGVRLPSLVGIDKAVGELRDINPVLSGLFLGHISAIAKAFHAHQRRAA